jgi:hypothetical protein
VRGGSWNNEARRLRSAYRNERHRDNRNENQGFRFALSSMEPTAWTCREPWTRRDVLPSRLAVPANRKAPGAPVGENGGCRRRQPPGSPPPSATAPPDEPRSARRPADPFRPKTRDGRQYCRLLARAPGVTTPTGCGSTSSWPASCSASAGSNPDEFMDGLTGRRARTREGRRAAAPRALDHRLLARRHRLHTGAVAGGDGRGESERFPGRRAQPGRERVVG